MAVAGSRFSLMELVEEGCGLILMAKGRPMHL